jgi:hypothetical protein
MKITIAVLRLAPRISDALLSQPQWGPNFIGPALAA